ncbi:hypothetical protein GOODEAATRI_022066, partial [Goodea atripinnis]
TLRLLPVLICCFPADLFTRASDRTDAAINHGSETGIISIPSQSLQRQGQASDPAPATMGPPAPIWPSSCGDIPEGMFWWETVTEVTTWLPPSLICRGFGAMARGSACWRAWEADGMAGCWLWGVGNTRPGDRLVEARVC